MSTVRRVVTGHRPDGKSIIASDEKVQGIDMPGSSGSHLNAVWGTDETLTYPDDGSEPSYTEWFPPVGGFRFVEFSLAPDSTPPADGNPEETAAEVNRLFPGLLSTMKADDPGMHRSATIDTLYVVSGRCVLELDDGSKTELGPGDVVIQSGTMHRWHNPWDEPCRIVGALVGAHLK